MAGVYHAGDFGRRVVSKSLSHAHARRGVRTVSHGQTSGYHELGAVHSLNDAKRHETLLS